MNLSNKYYIPFSNEYYIPYSNKYYITFSNEYYILFSNEYYIPYLLVNTNGNASCIINGTVNEFNKYLKNKTRE